MQLPKKGMVLPNGILPKLYEITGISRMILSGYVTTKNRPGGLRALKLQEACKQMGRDVSFSLWLLGSADEIKTALIYNKIDVPKKKSSLWQKLSFFAKASKDKFFWKK